MKLRYSPTSPYVRKVTVTALELGLDERIERVETNVGDPKTDIARDNPLGKVPALITDEGLTLCDSPLICEYLTSLKHDAGLLPASGTARWKVLNRAALADGILDAAVARVMEERVRPEDKRWPGWHERQGRKVRATLDRLEQEAAAGEIEQSLDLGTIALGCALGYLDFRFAGEDWRSERPALAAWYETFAQRPSMTATVPAG